MGKMSRRKGAAGELEVAKMLVAAGFECRRDGRLDDDLVHNVQGFFFEVKRRETLALPAWHRQAEEAAGEGQEPVVVYRRSREPWRASLSFVRLAELLAIERHYRREHESSA